MATEAKESKAARRKREREETEKSGSKSTGRLADSDTSYDLSSLAPDDGVVIKSDQGGGGAEVVDDSTASSSTSLASSASERVSSPQPDPQTPARRQRRRTSRRREQHSTGSGPFSKRPAPLTTRSLNTTEELWRRYEQLAVDVTELGRKVSVAEVIRLVLGAQLPDLTTNEGKTEAFELASTWSRKRGRGQSTAKFSAIRLRVPMDRELSDLAFEAKKAGASLDPSPLISGVLDTSELTPDQIKMLNDE